MWERVQWELVKCIILGKTLDRNMKYKRFMNHLNNYNERI